jgi:hypothetical protein
MPYTSKREIIKIGVIVIAFFITIPIIFLSLPKKGHVIRIDCTWSEISPDFTNAMREACRQVRAEKTCKNLNKPI